MIGSEKNKSFAVELPSSSEWVKKYEFTSIEAIPKKSGQPEVVLNFSFKNKETNAVNIIPLKIEIRWSHGKYLDWLLKAQEMTKTKLREK